MNVGQRIREARKKSGYTQKELSEKSGVATVSIQQYERGVRQPRIVQLQRIAAALGVEPWELMGFDGSIRVRVPPDRPAPADSEKDLEKFIGSLDKIAGTFPAEDKIKWALLRLTDDGKQKLADYAMDLTKIPEYCRQEPPQE